MKEFKIVVDVQRQEAHLYLDGQKIKTYVISTSAKGTGTEIGSYKTPTGRFKITQKIGHNEPEGAVFKARVATGDIWSKEPTNPLSLSEEDLILTRILWLAGLEEQNANTHQRYIYFHGTNQEGLLGQPSSHGCIRMSNKDVIDLFDQVPKGTEVEIK